MIGRTVKAKDIQDKEVTGEVIYEFIGASGGVKVKAITFLLVLAMNNKVHTVNPKSITEIIKS